MLINRQLRDFIPTHRAQLVGPTWNRLARQREEALAIWGAKLKERLQQQTRTLPPLVTGERVVIQNQTGNYPRRWDKTGTILEPKGFDQYSVVTDGSRRITLRNRRYLRRIAIPEERVGIQVPLMNDLTGERRNHTIQAQEDIASQTEGQAVQTDQETKHCLTLDDIVQEDQEDDEAQKRNNEEAEPRRSSRGNKGLTTRYDDFVT